VASRPLSQARKGHPNHEPDEHERTAGRGRAVPHHRRSRRQLVRPQTRHYRSRARIIAQLDGEEKSLRDRFEAEAREWARAELAKRRNRRRSLHLLQGTFAFRTVPATLHVDDLAAALSTAASLGAVKVDAEAYRRYALDTLKRTGEVLPGCVQQGEREHFSVRFGKDSAGTTEERAQVGLSPTGCPTNLLMV